MLQFSNIAPAVFAAVLTELEGAATITPNGDGSWIMQGSGITATVTYANGLVRVEIQHKPFFVSETAIGSKIRNAIEVALQALARQGESGGTAA